MSSATPGNARVVEPVLDHAAVENARLVNAARARLLRSGTAVTVEAIAEACGKSPATVRRWVARQRRAGRLATVTHQRQTLVPTALLDDAFDVDEAGAAIVGPLVQAGMDGWAIWHWLETANTWLDGDTPARRLAAGDTAVVERAVRGLLAPEG